MPQKDPSWYSHSDNIAFLAKRWAQEGKSVKDSRSYLLLKLVLGLLLMVLMIAFLMLFPSFWPAWIPIFLLDCPLCFLFLKKLRKQE